MAGPDKETARFEALLRRELKNAPVSAGADCPGAQALAAYYDRALGRGERRRVEAHLLECARCQSAMAAMARADDGGAPSREAGAGAGWLWLARLIAPAAVLAVAVAVIILNANRAAHRASPEQLALASRPAMPKLESMERPQPRSPAPAKAFGSGVGVASAPLTSPEPAPSLEPHEAAPAAPSAAAGAAAGAAAAPDTEAVEAQQSNPPSNPPASGALRESVSAPSAAPGAIPQAGVPGGAGPPSGIFVVQSPYSVVTWRIGPRGMIERLRKGGWESEQSGVTADLLAGSAPHANVCWVAGKAGTVLRTIDGGTHWQKLAPPSTQDLVRVQSRDDDTATVEAANGRQFSTHDGGRTWTSP